jgi:hypothetical protein
MTADVIDIDEVRIVRGLLEIALREGVPAEELRTTLALSIQAISSMQPHTLRRASGRTPSAKRWSVPRSA